MKKINPIIKFNSGNPIALCNRCFVIMCYVSCTEKDGEFCKVLSPNDKYTTSVAGDETPLYCNKCKELLTYSEQ